MAGLLAGGALAIFACGAVGAAAAAAAADGPQLIVSPAAGPVDAPFHVVIRNVLPGSRVKLSAQRPDVHGRSWTAVGVYLADANGSVDLDTAPSLGGSYQGVSPHALWCSALPVAPEELTAYVAQLPKHPE